MFFQDPGEHNLAPNPANLEGTVCCVLGQADALSSLRIYSPSLVHFAGLHFSMSDSRIKYVFTLHFYCGPRTEPPVILSLAKLAALSEMEPEELHATAVLYWVAKGVLKEVPDPTDGQSATPGKCQALCVLQSLHL